MPTAEVNGSLSDLDSAMLHNVAQLAEYHSAEEQSSNHHAHAFAGDGLHFSSASDEIVVAFVFYSIGISNSIILGSSWNQANSEEQKRLRDDIATIFGGNHGIQCLFLNGFGEMDTTIDATLRSARGVLQPPTQQYFQELVQNISLPHLTVRTIAPYVALIDLRYWEVIECVSLKKLCSQKKCHEA